MPARTPTALSTRTVLSVPTALAARAVSAAAVVLAGGALLAACGGPSAPTPAPASRPSVSPSASLPPASLAGRICSAARLAAAKALGSPLAARVTSAASYEWRCVLTGRRVRVTVDAQPGGQAYTEFNTEVSHQEQVYGPLNQPGQIPSAITVPGTVAAVWVRAQSLLVATDANPGGAGTYVTVAITTGAIPVAEAAARAVFAARPDGSGPR